MTLTLIYIANNNNFIKNLFKNKCQRTSKGQSKNGKSRDTANIGYTRHRAKTKQKHTPKRTERTITKWTIPKNWQNWVHKTQDEDEKQNKTYITIGKQTQIT